MCSWLDRERRRDGDAAQQRPDEHAGLAGARGDLADRGRVVGQRLPRRARPRASRPRPARTSPTASWEPSGAERVAQRALELAAALDQPLGLVGVEDGHRGRAAARVAGVRGAVAEHRAAGLAEEGRGDLARGDHAAEREVAAGHALGERDHVRLDVGPALDAEPGAEPPEGADHGVDHEQDPVLLAEVRDALDVALGREVDAAGADHRLAEERGARARARRGGSPARAPGSESKATAEVCGTSGPQLAVFASMPPIEVPKPCVPW